MKIRVILYKVKLILINLVKWLRNYKWTYCASKDLLIMQETATFLTLQYKKGVFNRYDTIVRYLAVENYFSKNDFGFTFYRKMQSKRGFSEGAEAKFKLLIDNVSENGFDVHSLMPVDKNQALIDGSHRLALALYFNQQLIPLRLLRFKKTAFYGIKWFQENGFSEKEIQIIENKRLEIFYERGLYFQVILWPPVFEFFNEIEKSISQKYNVIKSYTKSVEQNMRSLTFDIYKSDDIEDWKIDKKLKGFSNYKKVIKIIEIEVVEPRFRKKAKTNQNISREVEAIKEKYRERYRSKIPNYFKDTIMHIGDNYYQTREIGKVLNKLDKINE